jgi:hypothetical protein
MGGLTVLYCYGRTVLLRWIRFFGISNSRPKAAETRFVSQISIEFWELGDLFAHDSNGPAVRTNLWDGLQQGAAAGEGLEQGSSWDGLQQGAAAGEGLEQGSGWDGLQQGAVAGLCFCDASATTCHRPSSIHHMQPLLQPATAEAASAAFGLCPNQQPPKHPSELGRRLL